MKLTAEDELCAYVEDAVARFPKAVADYRRGKTNAIRQLMADIASGEMGAATSDTPGTMGFVPAPAAGDQEKVLRGDGTWVDAPQPDVTADGSTTPRSLAERFADVTNVKDFGAVGDGATDDTAAFADAMATGKPVYVPAGTYLVGCGDGLDTRKCFGPGLVENGDAGGITFPLEPLLSGDNTAQRYIMEVKNPSSNSTTQALAAYGDMLWRSQDGNSLLSQPRPNKYAWDNVAVLTEMPLSEHSRDTINYTTDAAIDPETGLPYTVAPARTIYLKGIGHGDGFAFASSGGAPYLYAHASAPYGTCTGYVAYGDVTLSGDADDGYEIAGGVTDSQYITASNVIISGSTLLTDIGCPATEEDAQTAGYADLAAAQKDYAAMRAAYAGHNTALDAVIEAAAAGVIRIPWTTPPAGTSAGSPYVPSAAGGCVWFRNIPRVTNGNFGLSADGKWMLFVDRIITHDVKGLERQTYTLQVTVYKRANIEAVTPDASGVADCSELTPYAVFTLPLPEEEDTEYAESGITSDGKNIYIIFCGARIVSRCLIEVWTLEGLHVASLSTGTIRDEEPDVFQQGVAAVGSRWYPFRYEVEGATFWKGKLLTASRYLFTQVTTAATSLVRWNGKTYVWSSSNSLWKSGADYLLKDSGGNVVQTLTAVPRPSNIAYWSPSSFDDGTIADYEATPSVADGQLYVRGSSVFHHYITAFQTPSGDAEEWGLDTDVWEWPAVRSEINPVVTRRELFWAYNPINSHVVFPIMSADRDGGFYTFNAVDYLNGMYDNATPYGSKTWVTGNSVSYGTTLGRSAYSVQFDADNGRANLYANSGLPLSLANDAVIARSNTYPATTSAYNLGKASNLWKEVFAAAGTINTSDARLKDNLADPDEALMRAWGKVHIKVFQFRDAIAQKGEAARLHVGVIAQQIVEAFASEGLDATRYGLLCHDAWDAQPEVRDKDGNVTEEAREAGDLWSVRYTEALALECAYQRWITGKLIQRMDEMEAVIAATMTE